MTMTPLNARRAFAFATLALGTSTSASAQRTAADAALRRFLGTANAIVVEPTPVPRATLRDAASLVAETQSRETPRPMMATQRDADGSHPMAQVGDSLFAFDEPTRSSSAVVVAARARFRAATGYDGGLDYPGWAYALDGKSTALFDAVQGGAGFMLYPWRLPSTPPVQASATERRSLAGLVRPAVASAAERAVKQYAATRSYGTASEIRRKISGPAGLGVFGDTAMSPVFVVRGPAHARLLFTSSSLGDDLSDHGEDQVVTLFADGGQLVSGSANRYDVVAVTDLDHDGIDEIITRDGVIRWTGQAWQWPIHRAAGTD